jgi:tetratricopeptide (TPR) repeat protein
MKSSSSPMSDPIESLCSVLLDIAQTSPGANINDVMARVKSALDQNGELTNALQTDARLIQINLGQSKGYQVLVEGNATAYIGDRYEFDAEAVIKALGQLLDEIALSQSPVGTPQNLPRSGVVEFVGRDSKLKELHAQLQNNRRIAIAAVQGMGGIGKTELALQYAIAQSQQGQYPAGLCWLRARDREIATDIVNFAQVHLGLKLPEQLEIDAQVAFCWQRWPEGEALVVLDDVTDYQAIEPYLPPADPRFKLLITTRLDLGSTVQKVAIEELDEVSAIALLESLVGGERIRSQLDSAKVLCEWVGNLPLGLELLGRFLANDLDLSIEELLDDLESMRLEAEALKERETGMTASFGIVATLELSWKDLTEIEQNLACLLGMFEIAPISWELVNQCFPGRDLQELRRTRNKGLMARSLLKRVGYGSYQLHQIVQEYFRTKLKQNENRGQATIDIFCDVMLENSKRIDKIFKFREMQKESNLIPHLEKLVNKSELFSNEISISLYLGLGKFHTLIGDENKAIKRYNFFLEIYKENNQENNQESLLDLAIVKCRLGVLKTNQRSYREAKYLLEESLETRNKYLDAMSREIADSKFNLGMLYYYQGSFERAEENPEYGKFFEDAEQIIKESLEILNSYSIKDDSLQLEIAEIQNGLSLVYLIYKERGYLEKAMEFSILALGIKQDILSEDDPSTLRTMNNLAGIYRDMKRFEEAIKLYEDVLILKENIYGNEHLESAITLNNLGACYYQHREFKSSKKCHYKALIIRTLQLGSEDVRVGYSLKNLSCVYYKLKQFKISKILEEKADSIIKLNSSSSLSSTRSIKEIMNLLEQDMIDKVESTFDNNDTTQ